MNINDIKPSVIKINDIKPIFDTIEYTERLTTTQGYSFNEVGQSFNEAGVQFGGIYGAEGRNPKIDSINKIW